jgi:hypothetical protein
VKQAGGKHEETLGKLPGWNNVHELPLKLTDENKNTQKRQKAVRWNLLARHFAVDQNFPRSAFRCRQEESS